MSHLLFELEAARARPSYLRVRLLNGDRLSLAVAIGRLTLGVTQGHVTLLPCYVT